MLERDGQTLVVHLEPLYGFSYQYTTETLKL